MNESVELHDRTFARTIKSSGATFTVESISHDADWGPKAARIRADGTLEALNKLLLNLRCEVIIRDGAGRETWWGCLWGVEIYKGSIKYGLTLDGFANKINVVYLQQTINQQFSGAGTQAETGFGSDTASQAEYGTWEMRVRGGNSSGAAATAERAKELANRAKPQSIGTTVGGGSAGSPTAAYAIINCWGWKKTLDKRFYTNSSGNVAGFEQNDAVADPETTQFLGYGQAFTELQFIANYKLKTNGADFAHLSPLTGHIFVQNTTSNNKTWTVVSNNPDGEGPGVSISVTPTNVVDEASGTANVIAVGTKLWQTFALADDHPFYAAALDVRCKKVNATDDLVISIYSVSGGLPDTLLATATITNAELPTTLGWVTGVLGSQPLIDYGVTYGILIERSSGTFTDGTYFEIGVDETLAYSRGSLQLYTDATNGWKTRLTNADLIFKISGVVETTTQIDGLVSSVGEFITDVVIENASGLKTLPYRDGTETALQVVGDLQGKGTSNNKRLLSRVTPKRELVVYEEPSPDSPAGYRLRDDGLLYTLSGQPVPPHTCPVGQWVIVDDLVLAQAPTTQVFVEEVEYRPKDGTFRIVRTRDRRSERDLFG